MYFYEWMAFDGREKIDYQKLVSDTEKRKRHGKTVPPVTVDRSVSEAVFDNESLYSHSDTYIDVRTPNDEKRGLITLAAGTGGLMLCLAAIAAIWFPIEDFTRGADVNGNPLGWEFYVFTAALTPLTSLGALYLYFRYVFCQFRLEAFTARRLIVRFNRITRKVYLLRPKHLGGVVALDWDKAEVCLDPNMSEAEGAGGFVLLGWEKESHAVYDAEGRPKDDFEITFVGKPTRNASELLAFWEYIRRYMEEGPQAAPRPKRLISKFPWPWNSFKAAWRLDTGFVGKPALWLFVVINLLLLPVILIHAFFHWVSLLLCYEPRFPEAIEQAGKQRENVD
ncbi:DUF6708 domain-containing protein [Pseudomonas sp. Irchel s3h17]|uniref:DUF6708 domain-containing protein n=1 Tax=Pseudomonas sp. Irchel s3h17 TaxID=2009182 RepID=UPI0021154474|nr:DUF6708 domain-containing protein [Pseudomonas sp. Irchel s3h17]